MATTAKKEPEQALNIEELKKQFLEETKKEAAEIIKAAKEEAKAVIKAASTGTEEPYHETEEEIAAANKKVKIKLFKDSGAYKDDVLIIVNGESYLIKRGVKVEVPKKVYDIIKASEAQIGAAADYMLQEQENFEGKKGVLA